MAPMDVEMDSSNDAYTILRIKRKRKDEPLDALLVEATKRRKGAKVVADAGVFQFAETVEESVWEDETKTHEMKERITLLARKTIPLRKLVDAKTKAPQPPTGPPSPTKEPTRRFTIVSNNAKSNGRESSPIKMLDSPEKKPSVFTPLPPLHPPVVRSARELREERENASASRFKVYDAVPLSQEASITKEIDMDDDPRMANFIPMLEEYLRINDVDLRPQEPGPKLDKPTDDDYVWDVFIHRTMSLDEWNSVALLGSVTGLPDDDDYPSDESEVEDEADEDSNDENWYANDYPDEEESEEEDLVSDDEGSFTRWR